MAAAPPEAEETPEDEEIPGEELPELVDDDEDDPEVEEPELAEDEPVPFTADGRAARADARVVSAPATVTAAVTAVAARAVPQVIFLTRRRPVSRAALACACGAAVIGHSIAVLPVGPA